MAVAVAKQLKKLQQKQSFKKESNEEMKASMMLIINVAKSPGISLTIVLEMDNDVPIPKKLKLIMKPKGSVASALAVTKKLKLLKILKMTLTSKVKTTTKEPPVRKRLQKVLTTNPKQALKNKKPTQSCIVEFKSSHGQD